MTAFNLTHMPRTKYSQLDPFVPKVSRNRLLLESPFDKLCLSIERESRAAENPRRHLTLRKCRAWKSLLFPWPGWHGAYKMQRPCERHNSSFEWLFESHSSIISRLRRQTQYSILSTAFRHWISNYPDIENSLQIESRTYCSTTYRLHGYTRRIRIRLTWAGHAEINPYLPMGDGLFDYLRWVECCPRPAVGGFLDKFNLPEYQVVYPTLESLYQEGIFPDFNDWFYEELRKSDLLVIEWNDEGSGGVRLAKHGDEIPAGSDGWHVFSLPLTKPDYEF